jgi:CspA family cold shock protein
MVLTKEAEGSRRSLYSLVLFDKKQTSMTGTIKKLTDKGFGFISYEGAAKDLFFHSKSLVGVMFDELREGDKVSFETEQSEKGPNAVNVQRA